MVPFLILLQRAETVTISCIAAPNVRRMRAVGDFNHWNAPGEAMSLSKDGLHWNLTLSLSPGVYRYVLLKNSETVPTAEAFKQEVKVIILAPLDFKKYPAIKGDGLITGSGVAHFGDSRDVHRLNAFTYELILRTRKQDVDSESVAVWSEGGEQKTYPMRYDSSDPLFDYFSVKVVVSAAKTFYYRFLLDDGEGTRCFDTEGLSPGVIGGKPFEIGPNDFKIPVKS